MRVYDLTTKEICALEGSKIYYYDSHKKIYYKVQVLNCIPFEIFKQNQLVIANIETNGVYKADIENLYLPSKLLSLLLNDK